LIDRVIAIPATSLAGGGGSIWTQPGNRADMSCGGTRRAVSRGLDGLWYCKAMAQPRPIYNQPDIRESGEDEPVFLCEGEKDCDVMESHGLLATTSSERD